MFHRKRCVSRSNLAQCLHTACHPPSRFGASEDEPHFPFGVCGEWHMNSVISDPPSLFRELRWAGHFCKKVSWHKRKEMLLMRITWMPRLCIPMKDVASCDKLRSAARQALPAEDFRMGKPLWGNAHRPRIRGEDTLWTETSHVTGEKKSNEIPWVVASEKGSA